MMIIQKALESDAQSLRSAAMSAFLNDEQYKPEDAISGGPPGHDTIESHVYWIKRHDYFKCVVGGKVVGGCIVQKHPFHFELFGIFLDSHSIGRGMGSKLLQGVLKQYPAGALWILETPDYATRNQRFYERNGFVLTEKSAINPVLGFGFFVYRRRA